eukprot:scaffold1883_cov108-Isochrysis_galbana.AAC.4
MAADVPRFRREPRRELCPGGGPRGRPLPPSRTVSHPRHNQQLAPGGQRCRHRIQTGADRPRALIKHRKRQTLRVVSLEGVREPHRGQRVGVPQTGPGEVEDDDPAGEQRRGGIEACVHRLQPRHGGRAFAAGVSMIGRAREADVGHRLVQHISAHPPQPDRGRARTTAEHTRHPTGAPAERVQKPHERGGAVLVGE